MKGLFVSGGWQARFRSRERSALLDAESALMGMGTSAGVRLETLGVRHAVAVQRLVCHPDLALTTRLPVPYPKDGARQFIDQCLREQEQGQTYGFAIFHGDTLVGLCGIHGIRSAEGGELGYWIGRPFWGHGFATAAVALSVDYAFDYIKLPRLRAEVLEFNLSSRKVLEKNGFKLLTYRVHDSQRWRADERLAHYLIEPAVWREHQTARILACLNPMLRAILEVETAAGNVVLEARRDWPEPGNLFVRLRDPFHHRRTLLPDGVVYAEAKAPDWWEAEFTSRNPRHILAY